MSERIGEQLTRLSRGDPIGVTVEGDRYEGDVVGTKRWLCELNHGFMESGEIRIRVELDAETVDRHELPGAYVRIVATENAPRSWDVPRASSYDPVEDEVVTELGSVTAIDVGSTPA
ncbi:hypothetical protein [Halorubrum halodurans]|uniref:Uncharacterized protein n=1 Tax=Halorubrum halodurans TaxID=1383851 RepID=A0A256IDH0_9EURY|nr:hypothetical protein [Halorubrum halodurans]OYR54523.1 hypothetical protein DJ70_13725 [Halorubrum halodurans]